MSSHRVWLAGSGKNLSGYAGRAILCSVHICLIVSAHDGDGDPVLAVAYPR